MTTDNATTQQQTPANPEPLDLKGPIGAEFAKAFGGGEAALAAAINGAPAPAQQQQASQQQKPGDGQGQEGADDDPFKDIDVETLLKSKALGPKLNSWADKAHLAQVRAAEARARQEGETTGIQKGKEQLTQEQEDRFFSSLSEDELAAELRSDPSLKPRHAQYLERQKNGGGGASNGGPAPSEEDIALATQTLALASQIESTLKLIDKSGLSEEVRAQLAPEKYVDRGAQGVADWASDVQLAIAKAEGAKQVAETTSDANEAAIQRRNAADDRARPGSLRPGQTSGVLPDLMATPMKEQFEMAFGSGVPRKV